MTVFSDQKKFITQWRSRSANEWRGQPNKRKYFTLSNQNPDHCENSITTDLDMEKFIEQLRREHGMDVTHMNSRVQHQERFVSATLAVLSTIFDSKLSEPIVKSSPCVKSYIHPILVPSIDENNVVLQHIAQPETSEESSQSSESFKTLWT